VYKVIKARRSQAPGLFYPLRCPAVPRSDFVDPKPRHFAPSAKRAGVFPLRQLKIKTSPKFKPEAVKWAAAGEIELTKAAAPAQGGNVPAALLLRQGGAKIR
jgi:hypothetical protein